jgi:hypothetical protein
VKDAESNKILYLKGFSFTLIHRISEALEIIREAMGNYEAGTHLLIRDDTSGPFAPDNAGWRVARRYRRRSTARRQTSVT